MNSPQSEETSEPSVTMVFRLTDSQMLPPFCPACGAPGTRPIPVPVETPDRETSGIDAYYCDICADAQDAEKTRSLGLLAACAIVVLTAATTCALAFGTRQILLQIVVTVVLGASFPEFVQRTGIWKAGPHALALRSRGEELLLVCRSRRFARALGEHGFSAEAESSRPRPPSRKPKGVTISLVLGGLAWLGLIHSLGGARVRVVVSGKEKAVLLVDSRLFGTISPTNAEDPRAGQALRVLGGRRTLELIAHSGERLGGETKTIWPGRTYIVGQLPTGQCLFWERRTYGENASRSLLYPVSGSGPIWELRDQVDSWFVPLEQVASADSSPDSNWETSGGTRRAIRLLPCRGTDASQ